MRYCYLLIILIFSACSVLEKTESSNKTQNESAQFEFRIFSKIERDCEIYSPGDMVEYRMKFYDSQSNLLNDTNIIREIGRWENGPSWNSLLSRLQSCDSSVLTQKVFYDINIPENAEFASLVPVKKHSIFCGISNPFFKKVNNDGEIENKIQPDKFNVFSQVEYGDTIIFQQYILINQNTWSKLSESCLDTMIYELSKNTKWVKKWELNSFAKEVIHKLDSNDISDLNVPTLKNENNILNYIHVDTILHHKKITSLKVEDDDWTYLKEGLGVIKIDSGKGDIAMQGKWIKIHYNIQNDEKNVVYSSRSDEALFFYIGEETVPKSWNEVLLNSKVGDRIKVKADPFWGYGREGLYPIVKPNSVVYFEFEVLGVQE